MSSPINPNTTFSQDVRSLAKAPDKKENGPMGQQVSELAHEKKIGEVKEPIHVTQKKQLNAAIIESSLKFSNTIGDKPLSLMLKTALQGINEALKASGVDSNVEDAYESGVDFSPEATAERIVSFSTQFLGSYREQHPEMSEEESLTAFVDIISGGIDQGFGEAKDILGGLKVLAGDIESNIDKTYTLIQEGIQSFVDSFSEKESE
ncbi:DUF5610 domain-containing protein [Colwellia sp. 12G3]|uniref:DUF5610 domain-containing protein n=1 Tax=Colwellia sp. 12G3 TaxID=2058299 RepID=UPI000C32237E|nr:DUF5610 domain-containing protein [Colwellia sp. 12G3]PKI14897.1 hypothetical protein CXF71_14170 [Colwellia sp. 12G3]